MKVFCPKHRRSFTISAATPIVCDREGGHLLGGAPNDLATKEIWAYCCNCANIFPISADRVAESQCPVCDREITTRFLCEHCHTLSFESSDLGKKKEFWLTSEGLPQPSCAGCSKTTNNGLQEHECETLAATYKTARDSCPFCADALGTTPTFPCSASRLIEDFRGSARQLEFDPEKNLLQESQSGEYLLLTQVRISGRSVVIPRSPRLNNERDYYDSYRELFNCANPAIGEVIIISPAAVEKSGSGWLLREPGIIEIKSNQKVSARKPTVKCANCGTVGTIEHAFCKRCGAALKDPGRSQTSMATSDARSSNANSGKATSDLQGHLNNAGPDANSSRLTFAPTAMSTGGLSASAKVILGVAAAIVLCTIAIVSFVSSGDSVEKKLDYAIAKGNLFTPLNQSAYDFYNQLKTSGSSEETLKRYREKIVPQLTKPPSQLISQFMVPGNDDPTVVEWQNAAQSLNWARELMPTDASIGARADYCQGRIAFLMKQEDQALQYWTRAAEADRSWPLPVNGMGLIYAARKNYSTARSYYFEAIRRDPNWAYPYNNLGSSFYMEKNYPKAKDYYKKAVQLAPHWARPHSWLGDIAMKEHDFNTAAAEFNMVLDSRATGTRNMDLDKIRKQLELAQQHAPVSD